MVLTCLRRGSLLFGTCLVGSMGAAEAPVGPVVELPTFVVEQSVPLPPPESWQYASGEGYETLSQVSGRWTKQMVKEFLLFREAMGVVFPGLEPRPARPMIFIFCDSRQFSRLVPAERDMPLSADRN